MIFFTKLWEGFCFIFDSIFQIIFLPFKYTWSILNLIYRFIYPNYNDRQIKALKPIIQKINALRDEYMNLSNAQLKEKTFEFKDRLANGESCDDILVEAFATIKEASRRVTGYEHYDEQLMAAVVLHRGCMTEMKTGEGKTLAATPAVYLNALTGNSVHIATVNDYLAQRDAEEMGRIYSFLNITCGALLENMSLDEKQIIYSLDVVYATGSTLGFDYLYDNLARSTREIRQRGLDFVIVDEADKLLDDGRTPLIISCESDESLAYYSYFMDLVRSLTPADYDVEMHEKSVYFTESGLEKIHALLVQDNMVGPDENLYSTNQFHFVHCLNQCLHAYVMMKRNVDYIVDPQHGILLVDEHTGRILEGRRLSNGLHQALEAKEGVEIRSESKNSGSISYQKFFGLYKKFSGMSGTCLNEAEEFYEIYGVDTVAIPTHKPILRVDEDDEIYYDFADKFNAVVKEVKLAQEKSQPVLVITGSVEVSEIFAKKFRELGWKFNVLNAKRHKEEANIIAKAGMPKALTIATNMAGRGTDIQLGGNFDMEIRNLRERGMSEAEIESRKPSIKAEIAKNKKIVLEAGGLFVIGTERNESRRVDDQARGRAGRQGDPGKSKFMISLDDPLMKNLGNADWFRYIMCKGEPIVDPLITRQVEKAQRLVEARSFDSRKYLLKYDFVLDEQRSMIYEFRKKYLFAEDLTDQLSKFVQEKLHILKGLESSVGLEKMQDIFGVQCDDFDSGVALIERKQGLIASLLFKRILLETIDDLWSCHLSNLSYVRQITHLRAHGEKDPLVEYKIEASKLFESLLIEFVDQSLKRAFNHRIHKDLDNLDLDTLLANLNAIEKNFVEDEKTKEEIRFK